MAWHDMIKIVFFIRADVTRIPLRAHKRLLRTQKPSTTREWRSLELTSPHSTKSSSPAPLPNSASPSTSMRRRMDMLLRRRWIGSSQGTSKQDLWLWSSVPRTGRPTLLKGFGSPLLGNNDEKMIMKHLSLLLLTQVKILTATLEMQGLAQDVSFFRMVNSFPMF